MRVHFPPTAHNFDPTSESNTRKLENRWQRLWGPISSLIVLISKKVSLVIPMKSLNNVISNSHPDSFYKVITLRSENRMNPSLCWICVYFFLLRMHHPPLCAIVRTQFLLATSQTNTFLSSPPDINKLPSIDTHRQRTALLQMDEKKAMVFKSRH